MNIRQKHATKLLERKIREANNATGELMERLNLWHNHGQDRLGYYPYNPADSKLPVKIHCNTREYFAGVIAGASTEKGYAVIKAGFSYMTANSYWHIFATVTWASGKYCTGACAEHYLDAIQPVTEQDKNILTFILQCQKHHLENISNFPDEYPLCPENVKDAIRRESKTGAEMREKIASWHPFFPTKHDNAKRIFIEKLSIACGLWTDRGFDAPEVSSLLNTNKAATDMLQLAMAGHHDKLPDAILEFEPVQKGMENFINGYLADMQYLKKTILTLPDTYVFTVR